MRTSDPERSAIVIIKELDPSQAVDRFGRAGRDAEEQMAFSLRRAFGDDPSILVFNGIRLEDNGDAAQIDHLILHPYGMIIVESKSVTSQVRVNAQGEWTRRYNGHAQGVASPVRQAEVCRLRLVDSIPAIEYHYDAENVGPGDQVRHVAQINALALT